MKNVAFYLAPAALLAVGCTEILNIDVIYKGGGGGSGAGTPSDGGNGAGVSDGGSGAGPSDGGNGAGPTTGGNGGEGVGGTGGSPSMCEPPPVADECFADEFNGSKAECWDVFDPHTASILVNNGKLQVQPDTMNSAWWMGSPLGLTRGFLMSRYIQGDFAVVTKAKATDEDDDLLPPITTNGSYKMAGLFMRRYPDSETQENWVKLEVGFRGGGLMNGGNLVQPMGILGGVARGPDATQLHPYQVEEEFESWLGMCRDGNNIFLMYRYDDTGAFTRQPDDFSAIPEVQIDPCMQVGVIAGAYMGAPDVEAHFENVRMLRGPDLVINNDTVCSDMLQQLADDPASLSCGGCN